MAQLEKIEIKKIVANTGQIEGLPANPRQLDKDKFELLKENIKNYPELLDMRALIVYPHGDKFVVIGGNMRLKALKQLKYRTAPCFVVPENTPAEKLRAYTILDNAPFGAWDWDCLANEWEVEELGVWGVDVPDWGEIPEDEEEENTDPAKDKFLIEIVCKSEKEQNAAFAKVDALGLDCRMK